MDDTRAEGLGLFGTRPANTIPPSI
jgi:hypothetical protein